MCAEVLFRRPFQWYNNHETMLFELAMPLNSNLGIKFPRHNDKPLKLPVISLTSSDE